MLAVHQAKAEKSIGHMLRDLGGAFLPPLALIGNRLGFYKVICWLQDEWRRSVAIRELSRLNDHYLHDIGINRSDIDWIADAMVKRLRESRNGS
jgi:uncharacterized protein YjiS (DUF1127 family)